MIASIEAAVNRRAWGQQEELLATLVEINHALLVSFLRAWTATDKQHLIPGPLHIPRPTDPPKKKRSWFDLLASMPGRR